MDPNFSLVFNPAACFVFLLLSLGIFVYFFSNSHQNKTSIITFIILCTLELLYYFGFDYIFPYYFGSGGCFWFIHPRTVGFLWGIITSCIFYIFIWGQIGYFLGMVNSFDDESLSKSVFIVGIAALLIGLEFLPLVPAIGFIIGFIAVIIQIYQLGRIIFKLSNTILLGLRNAGVYLVCLAATAILLRNAPSAIMYIFDYIAY